MLTSPMTSSSVQVFTTLLDFAEEEFFNKTLLRFSKLKHPSPSDMFCERNYRATNVRSSEGRYVVTLPFKSEFPQTMQLGESRSYVLKIFCRSENSLLRKPSVKNVYSVLQLYLSLGHMCPVKSPQ